MHIKRLSYQQRCERFPPILCRLLTRRGRGKKARGLSDQQIADASGLPLATIKLLSYSLTWAAIDLPTHFAFLRGCDIDLDKRSSFRRLDWMRKSGYFWHLHRSPLWKSQFEELVRLYVEHCEK